MSGYTKRLTLTIVLLIAVFSLSALWPPAEAQQHCGLPEPAASDLASVIYWTELALADEHESWDAVMEFYDEDNGNLTGIGLHWGHIMRNLDALAHGVDPVEWQAIGVEVGCNDKYWNGCKE